MSFLVWPIVASARSASWRMTPLRNVRETDYDVGPKTGKRRFDDLLHSVNFQQIMTAVDFQTFSSFYATSLKHGTDKFVIPLWDGEEYFATIAKFVAPYDASLLAPGLMQVAMQFIATDLPVIDDAAIWMLSNYSGEDIIAWAASIHYEVHVHYPDVFLDQAAIWMLQNYSTADIISWVNQIEHEVHVHYPSVWPLPPSP